MKHCIIFFLASICLNVTADILNVDRSELLNMSDHQLTLMHSNSFLDQLQASGYGSSGNTAVTSVLTSPYNLAYVRQHLSQQGSTPSGSNPLMKDKIVFYSWYDWTYDNNGQITVIPVPYGQRGGRITHMKKRKGYQNNVVFGEDMIFDGIDQKMYIDYSNNSVRMPTFTLLGSVKYYEKYELGSWNDTLINVYMINEDYFTRNAEPHDVYGTLYNDGSITFEDGFIMYYIAYIRHYYKRNWVSTDTLTFSSYILRDLTLLAPNAKHEFTDEDVDKQADAYMFQADDTTRVIMNLWGLGSHIGNVMYLHEDGSMRFPFQVIREFDVSSYNFDDVICSPKFYNFWSGIENSQPIDTYGTVTDGVISWAVNTVADTAIRGTAMLNGVGWGNGVMYPALWFGVFGSNRLYYADFEQTDDDDGTASISDVANIIDILLDECEWSTWSDVDDDGRVSIKDVATLIDIILNSN